MRDKTACTVVIRDHGRQEWAFMTHTTSVSGAEASAEATFNQERQALGNKRAEVKVMTRVDFEAGRFRASLRTFK